MLKNRMHDITPVVYQIYPLSFKASANHNYGDLQGIISKLDYLASLGVNYLWINPIFLSNFKDNGYDVINYYKVDPRFGTKRDLKKLIREAKKRRMFIMLDMVFNHTSTSHKWFKKWVNGSKRYRDFYISQYSENKTPTNWESKFGGSVWTEYRTNYYYLHLFDQTQADLNWKNPRVRKELQKVLKYYIKLGVKGFRFDVINLIDKVAFKDDLEGDGRKFYTDGPNVSLYLEELLSVIPQGHNFLTVGELSSTTIDKAILYSQNLLDSVFTFHHLKVDYVAGDKFIAKKPDIKLLNDILATWTTKVQLGQGQLANFLNNHDQPRSVSRFVDNARYYDVGAKMLFGLTSALPGIPYIFQGEEIGMTNPHFLEKEQYRDIETLNYFTKHKLKNATQGVLQKSRDNARTPMQWDDSIYSGFSQVKPWIDVNDNYRQINVLNQVNNLQSTWHFYRSMIHLIKTQPIFKNGKIEFLPFRNNVISYTRTYQHQKIQIIASFNHCKIAYPYQGKQILLNNYPRAKTLDNFLLPYQYLIIKI